MTHVATIDEDFGGPHLTSTQHALGWFEGGANIGRVLKYGENIRDRCDGQKGALKGENSKNKQEYIKGSQQFLLVCRMGHRKTVGTKGSMESSRIVQCTGQQDRALGGLDLSNHHTSSSSTLTCALCHILSSF